MHTLRLKQHEFHYPDRHESAVWFKRQMYSDRFWAIVSLVVLIGILLALGIIAETGDRPVVPTVGDELYRPYLP